MDDQELEQRLHDLKDKWRVAPEPPLDAMWARVAREAFAEPARPMHRRWLRTALDRKSVV